MKSSLKQVPAKQNSTLEGIAIRCTTAGTSIAEKGLCVGSCIKQCVCSATLSVDESAQHIAPLLANNGKDIQHFCITGVPMGWKIEELLVPLAAVLRFGMRSCFLLWQ